MILPPDLIKVGKQEDIVIYPYSSSRSSLKTRIVLDWHLFSFLQQGTKTVSYASGTEAINPDRFLFLPSGNCLMSEKSADNGKYRSLLLFVHKEVFGRFFEKHPEYTSASRHDDRIMGQQPISIEKDIFIYNLIDSLEIMSRAKDGFSSALCELKFEELMIYLVNKHPQLVGYFKSVCAGREEDYMLRSVMENHQDSVTVDELAFLCNMSVSTFKRKFTKIFDDSPKQWLLKKRMCRAEYLLREKGLTASDIYVMMGYENLSSFIQAFKKFYGVTPKQYQLSSPPI